LFGLSGNSPPWYLPEMNLSAYIAFKPRRSAAPLSSPPS